MPDLLFEIGCEEIPAGYIKPALEQLAAAFTGAMAELRVACGEAKTMGTPRRLALLVAGVAARQADMREELLGPAKAAGLDANGQFTKAAIGFARSKNAEVSDLNVVATAKGEYLQLARQVKGEDSKRLLPEVLSKIAAGLSFPKSMRWGAGKLAFARPIQWLLALLGEEVLPVRFEQLVAGRLSRGHRFLADVELALPSPATYQEMLRHHFVLADVAERRQAVARELDQAIAAAGLAGKGQVVVDEDLIDLDTNLVEIPFGVCGQFDEKFLELPPEVLITSMREHQKCFPVAGADGKLLAAFVAINNTRVRQAAVTCRGHQRVLRARLSDALFFYNEDRKIPLADCRARLSGIVFQAKLGTMLEKTTRLEKLARVLADKQAPAAAATAVRAAALCKADLMTNMVGEFPSLQGTMGTVYARLAGEPEAVAKAMEEHYLPRRADGELPASDAGAILGLADRIDSLAGCFGIGQAPTGATDPFGLRRLAVAVIHIVLDKKYRFSLREIIEKSLALYGDKVDASAATVQRLIQFVRGRFENDMAAKGYGPGIIQAATAASFDDLTEVIARLDALTGIRQRPEFAPLAVSCKRMRNICKDNRDTEIDAKLFDYPAEGNLYDAYLAAQAGMAPLLAAGRYAEALLVMLNLKEPVDQFFDQVMVMAEDAAVRRNRLNLLTATADLALKIGDLAKIQE
ncbi:MAG: glycine--tRNA ligase subunit beta [Desulfobulbaceae bacterium]|jgi:glycyl-tRNA synthetase beta chain|nr:glycine--tRNA ligase subunit beta [Desulfobulbaceae bacterium]